MKGRAFEELVAWYLRNAPEYRALFADVWLWRDWPGRWGADAGIDIVARTFSGQLWAVQAKAYDPDHVIRRRDIDSFLVESSRDVFVFRLLVASTDLLSRTAARTVHDQSTPVGLKLRSQLLVEDLAWPETLDGLGSDSAVGRKRPEPHQLEAIASVVSGLAKSDRGQLLMACGTGKTLTGMWVDEALGARRSLVLVPTLSLLGQTLRAWAAESAERFSYLSVCSDASVAPREDAFISHASDLGIPVTTDAGVVARFLGPGDDKRVIFATYQSSRVVADAQLDTGAGSLDLVIADEAHRCAGAGDGPFATVLSDAKVKAKRRLFMTATPRYVAAKAKAAADERDFPVASMDDAAIFGPVLHRLSFADAIERGLLADYQVVVIGVGGDRTYSDYVATRALVARDGDAVADAATLAAQIGLLKAMARFDLCRVLSFHSRVAAASAFAVELPDIARWLPENDRPAGALWARHVDGTMSAGVRDRELLRLRDASPETRGVLANVRCLGEGVDVPSIDAVAFMEPRSSVVDIIQAVGRAIRRADAKDEGTIIVPVFVQEGEDTEHALASSTFKPVWDVVRALRAHDEQLAEILDASRRRVGRTGVTPGIPEKVKVMDIPATVGADFAEAFAARLVETTTSSWEHGFGILERYVAREGSATTITKNEVVDGYALGHWVARQRARLRHERWPLSAERRRRLEEIPGWRWNKHDLSWERGFQALQRYVSDHGHARVPVEYVNEDGLALGYWVRRQRGKRAGKREGRLTQEQVDFLNTVPGWIWDARTAQWEDGYAALTQFVLREGHASPGT